MKCLICIFPVTALFEIQRADWMMESQWMYCGKRHYVYNKTNTSLHWYLFFTWSFPEALVNSCFVKGPVKNKYQYNAVCVFVPRLARRTIEKAVRYFAYLHPTAFSIVLEPVVVQVSYTSS